MKALTIKQPWASLIAHGIKNIENRTWKTNFRGRIYIHSSAKNAGSLYELLDRDQVNKINKYWISEYLPPRPLSAIIGEVDIIDCVINHPSVWADKTNTFLLDIGDVKPVYNWVLTNPILYNVPILNIKGKLSFWEFNEDMEVLQ